MNAENSVLIFSLMFFIITREQTTNRSSCGRNSAVECQLPKLDVAGSNPVARSLCLHDRIALESSNPKLFAIKTFLLTIAQVIRIINADIKKGIHPPCL